MGDKLYKGDVGTEVLVDCGCDLTGATVTRLKVEKPDGTVIEWTAAIHQNNYLKYVTVAGDFDQSGEYKLQAYVKLPDWEGHGETTRFRIYNEFA